MYKYKVILLKFLNLKFIMLPHGVVLCMHIHNAYVDCLSPYSADPLSNISGMLKFRSSEEAIAFAVKSGEEKFLSACACTVHCRCVIIFIIHVL